MYVLIFSCSKDDSKIETDANFYIPKGVITQERGEDLSKAWSEKNTSLFNKTGKAGAVEEITSLSWTLEDLRNYLDYAEHEATEKGYKMTGVRVYFAAYPDKGYQNTLFFAPTGHKNTSKANSFFMTLVGDHEDIPVPPLNEGLGGQGGYPQ